jgi:hypothetical protein
VLLFTFCMLFQVYMLRIDKYCWTPNCSWMSSGVKRFVYISAADFGLVNYLLKGYFAGKVQFVYSFIYYFSIIKLLVFRPSKMYDISALLVPILVQFLTGPIHMKSFQFYTLLVMLKDLYLYGISFFRS